MFPSAAVDITGLSIHVLPKYYKHSNFKSFVRQLHVYRFRKLQVDAESDWCVFQNPRFKRGHRHLLKTIRRKTNTLPAFAHVPNTKVRRRGMQHARWRMRSCARARFKFEVPSGCWGCELDGR